MLVGIVSENYTKLSNECAKSQQREYLESIKVAVNTTIPDQKEIFLSNNSSYRFPNTTYDAHGQSDKSVK